MNSRLHSAHSHRAPSSSGGNVGRDGSLEDRFQRLQQENNGLKLQRNELEEKLKELKTKFRRLLKDIKMTDADVDRLTSMGGDKESAVLGHLSPNHQAVEISQLNQKVATLTAQLQQQQLQHVGGGPVTNSQALQAEIMTLKVERLNDQRALENARNELNRMQEYVNTLQSQQQHRSHDQPLQQYQAEVNRLRERANADARAIENLVRERDSFSLQVRLLQDEEASGKSRGGLDPLSLIELQSSINDKATQITVLTNRLSYTQTQVNTLRGECERLVDEMRNVHNQHADVKKQLFDAQHQNAALSIRCDRMNELEQALLNKNEELLKVEQEVLKLIDKLQSCSRETELQIRRELNDRINELESMRDEADKARRGREKDVMLLQQELAEAKRRGDVALADLEVYRKELDKVQGERQDLAERSVLYGTMSTITDVDDDVHKALAMAHIRRRAGQSVLSEAPHGATMAGGALDMWEGMAWNDEWESGKLREALATAALNMELAETRCMQLTREAEDRDASAKGVAHERDVLLEENIEMRRRISNVQTMFVKQQLDKYREVMSSGQTNTGSVIFTISNISCDPRIQQMPDGSLYSPTLFISLDGLEGYHTMLSTNFYTVATALDTRFAYDALHIADTTVSQLQRTTFAFQLHQSFGLESVVVAMGEIAGSRLLTCRDGGLLFERVTLINDNGEKLGEIGVTIEVRNLFLPVLLDRPLSDMLLTADAVRAALISLRSIRSLRMQIFKATNLSEGATLMPRAYVFVTALPIDGITCLPDTTVSAQDAVACSSPIFDVVPRDFPVVLDRALVQFIAMTQVTFVVFDHNAQDVKANIGMATVPLKSLLRSPSETILVKEKLHPSGELEIGFSWVCSLE